MAGVIKINEELFYLLLLAIKNSIRCLYTDGNDPAVGKPSYMERAGENLWSND